MEYVTKTEITVRIETNKQTYEATFDHIQDAQEWLDDLLERLNE